MLKALIAAVGLSCMLATPASAVVIFSDNFNRAEDDIVGAPAAFPTKTWTEVSNATADVSIRFVGASAGVKCTGANIPAGCNNSLRISDNEPNAAASQLDLSTTGLQTISLSYDWAVRNVNSNADDFLLVQWNSGSGFVTVATHSLGGVEDIFASNTINFSTAANNLADFEFRFMLNLNGNGGAWVDNVVLNGTPLAVPEPASLALLGLGLLGLGFSKRKQS